MFLSILERRNPDFVRAVIHLHQTKKLPSNCYVLDLDIIEENARIFATAAAEHELTTFAMTKQVGRNSGFQRAIMRGGIDRAVAVDFECATACHKSGLKVGHLGHLVQIPQVDATCVAHVLRPDYWTVFSKDKACEAATAAYAAGYKQKLMARIYSNEDTFYRGHEGGFHAEAIVEVAHFINNLAGAVFAGITTFPALLFDASTHSVKPTPNLATLSRAKKVLENAGFCDFAVNAPGTTSTQSLPMLKQAGATQCEPGNGLHGTTPLHAYQDLPERPAMCYLSEISHIHNNEAYAFGGGLYIDPVFTDYQVHCLVSDGEAIRKAEVEIPPPSAIDYYAMIDQHAAQAKTGDSVIFGFRGQAFVTRACVAGVRGIANGNPQVECIEDGFGNSVSFPDYGLEK